MQPFNRSAIAGFNPRSARRRSATQALAGLCQLRTVSILAPPEGGAQLSIDTTIYPTVMFQSSLRPKAERNAGLLSLKLISMLFQSSLRPKAERNI